MKSECHQCQCTLNSCWDVSDIAVRTEAHTLPNPGALQLYMCTSNHPPCIHSMHVFWSVCLYQTKCTRPPLPVQVPDTSLAELWRWMSMETGFLSLILCDLLFIKIKLCVRKHNLFMLWYSYCSTSSLSCINARLCLSYRLRLANSAHFAHLTATFVPKFFSRHWFLPSAVSFNGIYVCVNVSVDICKHSLWINSIRLKIAPKAFESYHRIS